MQQNTQILPFVVKYHRIIHDFKLTLNQLVHFLYLFFSSLISIVYLKLSCDIHILSSSTFGFITIKLISKMSQSILKISLILVLFSFLCFCTYASKSADEAEVRHRMDEFVDTMRDTVHEAESANRKREVIDLGQSLHLLENKFAGLRAALAQELGAKSEKFQSHGNIAKELMDKNADLVQHVVSQREELRSLESDIKVVDTAIRSLKDALTNFEKDIADLRTIARDLHSSTGELAASHDDAKMRLKDVVHDAKSKKNTQGGHLWMYIAILVEMAALVAYLYMKKPGGAVAHKAYGKFG